MKDFGRSHYICLHTSRKPRNILSHPFSGLSWRTSRGPPFCAKLSARIFPSVAVSIPSVLLELITSTVGNLLVGAAHLLGVELAAAKLVLSLVESCKDQYSQCTAPSGRTKRYIPLSR